MPQCYKCANKPEMIYQGKKEAFEGPRPPPCASSTLRNAGHPYMALANTVLGGVKAVANHFLEDAEYKCPQCGLVSTELRRKT